MDLEPNVEDLRAPKGNNNDRYIYQLNKATSTTQDCPPNLQTCWHQLLLYLANEASLSYWSNMLHRETTSKVSSLIQESTKPSQWLDMGPKSVDGMDVFKLETKQAVQHAKLMVSHLWKNDEVSGMLKTTINQLQIQAGTLWWCSAIQEKSNKCIWILVTSRQCRHGSFQIA